MKNIVRNIAIPIRQRSEKRMVASVLKLFGAWQDFLNQLPTYKEGSKKLAIVRLDDIGDYLLFRNFLAFYKNAKKYKGYEVSLIGNLVWKPIFEAFDAGSVDNSIWIDKHKYLNDDAYRQEMLLQIRSENFETIVCPSRTRPLLLDDTIVIAAAAKHKIVAHNTFPYPDWNEFSDKLYDNLLPSNTSQHEFFYNKEFTEVATQESIPVSIPTLPIPSETIFPKQIICFIGASAKSKTWPIAYWIELIHELKKLGYQPLLSGGKNELSIAQQIVGATNVDSIVGQVDLVNTLKAIAAAKAVISGDTMAAHVAVALQKPTIILANGVNAKRFVAYEDAGFPFVKTIYTKQFLASDRAENYRAVSKDMDSIKAQMVIDLLQDLLN